MACAGKAIPLKLNKGRDEKIMVWNGEAPNLVSSMAAWQAAQVANGRGRLSTTEGGNDVNNVGNCSGQAGFRFHGP
jgi:hypothetical protein